MTCMRAWMISKFCRIRPQTTELAALKRMKKNSIDLMGKTMSSHFLRFFDWILFIFAGNVDMHKSLNEFKIWPDATTGFHGNRYIYCWKNGVITFSLTFLIGFISYLQVTMIYVRA